MRCLLATLLCIWSCFFSLPAWGQIPQTEKDFLAQLEKTRTDTGKVRLMCNYAWNLRSNVPTKSYEYAQKAHKLAVEANYTKGIIKAMSFMGVAMRNLGNYAIAGNYFDEALLLAQKNEYLEEEGYGNINVGNIYYLEGKYNDAKNYLDRALPIAHRLKDVKMRAYALLNLGRIYHKLKNEKEAFKAFEDAIAIRKELKDTLGIATVKFELAEAYLEQGKIKESKQYIELVENLAHHFQDFNMQAGVQNLMARIAITEGDTQLAEQLAYKGLKVATSINDKFRIAGLYKTLSDIESKKGDFEKAHQYLTKFVIYQDSLHQENIKTRTQQWEFSHKLQEQEKKIQQEQLEIQEKNFWLVILLSAFLLAVVAGGFIFLRYKQHEKSNKEIKEINKDLQASRTQAENYNAQLIELNNELHKRMEELRVSEDQQRRLNQNLTEKNNALHELNHEKDSLMGIVAHDLKAPLNRIRGILELMGLTGELNDDQRQLVQMGQDIIQSGSNLIRDLLDITYYEQGATKMRWEKLNWNEFLQEHIASFSQDAQKKNIELQLVLPTEPVESITDEDCLSRIFSNLLSNALKFSPKDRHILVTLEVLPTQIRLSIQDEGPGFTDEDKRKLFHKFEKLSAKPTAGEASTGLGLSIIKVLTEKLQGSVSLESEGGKGATFILTFAKRN